MLLRVRRFSWPTRMGLCLSAMVFTSTAVPSLRLHVQDLPEAIDILTPGGVYALVVDTPPSRFPLLAACIGGALSQGLLTSLLLATPPQPWLERLAQLGLPSPDEAVQTGRLSVPYPQPETASEVSPAPAVEVKPEPEFIPKPEAPTPSYAALLNSPLGSPLSYLSSHVLAADDRGVSGHTQLKAPTEQVPTSAPATVPYVWSDKPAAAHEPNTAALLQKMLQAAPTSQTPH